MFPSISTSNANFRPAAIKAIYARKSGEKWQTLGGITKGVINFPNLKTADSLKRNKAFGYSFKATASMLQASLVEIELMKDLCDGTTDFLFRYVDAGAIPGDADPVATEGWAILTAAQCNVKPGPDLSGNFKTNRTIPLEWTGSLKFTEWTAAIKAAILADNFESSTGTGTFHAIGVYTSDTDGGNPNEAHIVPNGVASITMQDAAGGSAVNIGEIKNFKGVLDFQSDPEQDERLRHQPYAVDIPISFEAKQTDAATLLTLKDMVQKEINIVITFVSGLILTLNNVLGIDTDFESAGDSDKIRVVKFNHMGSVLLSQLNGIVSGS